MTFLYIHVFCLDSALSLLSLTEDRKMIGNIKKTTNEYVICEELTRYTQDFECTVNFVSQTKIEHSQLFSVERCFYALAMQGRQ